MKFSGDGNHLKPEKCHLSRSLCGPSHAPIAEVRGSVGLGPLSVGQHGRDFNFDARPLFDQG